MSVKSVFIVWSRYSRRAESLAAELHGHAYFLCETRLKGLCLTPLRYLVQGWKTWRLLEQEQPEAVLVQSPPIFACLTVAVWCELRGTQPRRHRIPYALDCHTGTFHTRWWRWALPLLRFLSGRAAVTLVTDRAALDTLRRWKVKCLSLENALPILCLPTGSIGSEGEKRVAAICSFDADEPVAEIFTAAQLLPQVTFYVTGSLERVDVRLLARKPKNVILTGFLKGGVYTSLLNNVHGLLVLTNQSHAVNCGAYESVAMAKPAVISDWPDLRQCFTRGFIYVTNTPKAIAEGVQSMLNERVTLTTEVMAMCSELVTRRQPNFAELVALLTSNV